MKYKVAVVSDPGFEHLVAEILFANGVLIVVSQERDRSRFELSFFSPARDTDGIATSEALIDIDLFNSAIAEAQERLTLLDEPR